jgi:hypothetical protein
MPSTGPDLTETTTAPPEPSDAEPRVADRSLPERAAAERDAAGSLPSEQIGLEPTAAERTDLSTTGTPAASVADETVSHEPSTEAAAAPTAGRDEMSSSMSLQP